MVSLTNKLCEKWRSNLQFERDLKTWLGSDSNCKNGGNLGNLDTNQLFDDNEIVFMDEMMSGICCQTIWEEYQMRQYWYVFIVEGG